MQHQTLENSRVVIVLRFKSNYFRLPPSLTDIILHVLTDVLRDGLAVTNLSINTRLLLNLSAALLCMTGDRIELNVMEDSPCLTHLDTPPA